MHGSSFGQTQLAPQGTDPFQIGSWNGQQWVPWKDGAPATRGRVNDGGIGSVQGMTPAQIAQEEQEDAGTDLDPGYLAYLKANPTYINGKLIEPFGIAPSSIVDQNDVGGGFLDNLLNKGLPIATAAGLGAAFGPAAGAALVPAGAGAATSGAIVGGATGAISGGTGAALQGGNVGKGVLIGGATGALGGALKPVVQAGSTQLSDATGLSPGLSSGLVKTAAGAATGAASGALQGNAGAGALSGTTGSVQGSILSGLGNTIFQSGSAVTPTTNPSLTTPAAPMSDDGLDYINTGGQYITDPTEIPTIQQGGIDPGQNPGYQDLPVTGGGSTLGGGYTGSPNGGGSTNSSLLSSLASLLSGGGGSNSGLLAQLLGLGASGIGGALQSNAAKGAAGNFADATKYAPYSVNTANGSNTFNGTSATSTLSPGAAGNLNSLNGLVKSSAGSLAAGPNAAAQNQFNLLQNEDADTNAKFLQGTKDNEFANGVFSSTPGQYQTQAALDAINKQTTSNQITANNFGNTQQQQQLAQLTAGLNGTQSINQGQLAGLQLGGTLGGQASESNAVAQQPNLAANSGSNIGSLLTNLGSGVTNSGNSNNNALAAYLSKLFGGG